MGNPVGPVAGVLVAEKDVLLTKGVLTTAASEILASYVPGGMPMVGPFVGGRCGMLGKTATHEFAYGTAPTPTASPWNLRRTPGGSSGG